MIKKAAGVGVVGLVVGGLPFALDADMSDKVAQQLQAMTPSSVGSLFGSETSKDKGRGAFPSEEPPPAPASVTDAVGKLPPLTGEGVVQDHFAAVLRMDITHDWITNRWPRVTTVQSDPHMLGFRVPFMSGKRLDDVTGSLTYFFDDRSQLKRINLHGYTGDYRRLQRVVCELFKLSPEPSLQAGLYVSRWNALPTNVLFIQHAEVIRADQPHWRYEINLEINHPGHYYRLSDEFTALLGDRAKAVPRYIGP